jgi:TonB family protein
MTAALGNPAATNRRRMTRHAIAVPVDVTVLRSGVPDSIPGRTMDVGEGGMAAILAGELRPGDSVGIELRLQGFPEPLLARAVVRHQQHLRCGMEFQHLSSEQREVIRLWGGREELSRPREVARVSLPPPGLAVPTSRWRKSKLRRELVLWPAVLAALLITCVAAWQWRRGWDELESRVDKTPVAASALAKVDAAEIEHLVVHRVDPVYPEEAKRANLQGVVVLATVIGRDGSVERVSPVSGPDVLTSAAIDAVRWWRFQPYVIDGKAVEIETTLAVEFRL